VPTAAAVSGAGRWVLVVAAVVVVQFLLLRLRNRLRARLLVRDPDADPLKLYVRAFRPLLLLDSVDPLQYWVTTWNEVTRRRWRRAVLLEQTALAARRGDGPRQLPRGA
jgi:hypothetical protein